MYLIFWGSAWGNSPVPSVEDVTNAVIAVLVGPYMSRLQQYRVAGNAMLIGTQRVTTSDPPQSFSDSDVRTLVTGLIGTPGFPDFRNDDQLIYCVIMPSGISPMKTDVIGEHFNFSFARHGSLNVAGPRASKEPEVAQFVISTLDQALPHDQTP